MAIYSLAFSVQKAPPIMLRKRHVLILLRDQNSQYILGRKNIYPPGITRMVGGGVEEHEPFFAAAARELYEELKYSAPRKSLIELARVNALITDADQKKYQFNTAIYFVQLDKRPISPGDDLDDIARLSDPEFLSLIQKYKQLSKEIDSRFGFAWYDYGQLYSQIHQIAWQSLRKRDEQKHRLI
jgi:8-oxo-dGTP pyrophosphatase MutT (NUDIX family)